MSSEQEDIVEGQDSNKRLGKKTLTKTVNLIDISARFLSCYTGFAQHKTPISFLRADQGSLRAIYLMAVMLRDFMDKIMNEIEVKGIRNVIGKHMKDVNINGLSFNRMLPTPSKQLALLKTTLKKKNKDFNKVNMKANNEDEPVLSRSNEFEDQQDMSELGIVTFD